MTIKKNYLIPYSVKIHLADCQCSYYKKKSMNPQEIIVAPYKMEEYKKRYYIYTSEDHLQKDIDLFEDQCLCTYNKKTTLNGGVVLLSKFGISNLKFIDSNEMVDLCFYKISQTKNFSDNSKLIQEFYNYILYSEYNLLDWYILIGKTIGSSNFSFPKGKIKYGETSEECAYREFEEETGVKLDYSLISAKKQLSLREVYDFEDLPLEIILGNFLLKIIII
jgi:hypothetical protein